MWGPWRRCRIPSGHQVLGCEDWIKTVEFRELRVWDRPIDSDRPKLWRTRAQTFQTLHIFIYFPQRPPECPTRWSPARPCRCYPQTTCATPLEIMTWDWKNQGSERFRKVLKGLLAWFSICSKICFFNKVLIFVELILRKSDYHHILSFWSCSGGIVWSTFIVLDFTQFTLCSALLRTILNWLLTSPRRGGWDEPIHAQHKWTFQSPISLLCYLSHASKCSHDTNVNQRSRDIFNLPSSLSRQQYLWSAASVHGEPVPTQLIKSIKLNH